MRPNGHGSLQFPLRKLLQTSEVLPSSSLVVSWPFLCLFFWFLSFFGFFLGRGRLLGSVSFAPTTEVVSPLKTVVPSSVDSLRT